MNEYFESPKPIRMGRGRGFNPAIRREETPFGSPVKIEEPKKREKEIECWDDIDEVKSSSTTKEYKTKEYRTKERNGGGHDDVVEDKYNWGEDKANRSENKYNRSENKYNRSENKYNRSEDKYNWGEDKANRSENKYNWGEDKANRSENKYNRSEDKYNWGEDKANRSEDKYNWDEDKTNRSEDKYNWGEDKANRGEDNRSKFKSVFQPQSRRRFRDNRGGSERDSDGSNRSDRRDRKGRERDVEKWPKSGGFRDDDKEAPKPKPSRYIPKTPTEDEEEIFSSGISTGINFFKLDEMVVKVTGDNPPPPVRTFSKAGLKELMLDLIFRCNYIIPTPIQKYSIPIIMSGRDVMACAQTGSGKTAAFLIPIMNCLMDSPKSARGNDLICQPQALIVTPTRELTIQIFNEARKFSRGSRLRVEMAYGGTQVSHQIQCLTKKGCDVLVSTPGRLIDIIRRKKVVFTRLRFLVLDEADRMLDLGFLPDIEELMKHIEEEGTVDRQISMFSATFPEEIQLLAGKFLNNYLFVVVGIIGGACQDVDQIFYEVSKYDKREKLVELLENMNGCKCLVFVEQKRTTDVLAAFLSEKNFRATSIHGGREQREREEALEDFKSGRMNVLVATSVAARGLDIPKVAHVINYDLPKTIDEYVHRIGRTGRVGNRGSAISFYDESEDRSMAPCLVRVLSQTKQDIPEFLDKGAYGERGGGSHYNTRYGGKDIRSSYREEDFDDDDVMDQNFTKINRVGLDIRNVCEESW